MRCRLSERKTERLRQKTGLPIEYATVRGGTDHTVNLVMTDGAVWYLYKDGRLEKCLHKGVCERAKAAYRRYLRRLRIAGMKGRSLPTWSD